MEKVKNQHFVGQFYLKQFANKHKQIYVKDIKSSKSSFLTNIRNVAAKRYFYDIPDDINAMTNKNNQTIEKYLSVQEALLSEILRETIAITEEKNEDYCLTDYQRENLVAFKVFQWMRTDMYRKGSIRMKKLNNPNTPSKEIDSYQELIHAKELLEYDVIVDEINFYSQFVIVLIRNNTSVPFITSDNPVAIHYLEKNKEITKAFDLMMNNQKVTGFNDNDKFQYGISYLCPLSPTVAACFYERKYLENNNMSNFLELDNKITSCLEKFVRGANGLIYNQANSQIFSNIPLE